MSGAKNTRRNYEVAAKYRRRHYDGFVSGNCSPCSAIQPDESRSISIFIAGLKKNDVSSMAQEPLVSLFNDLGNGPIFNSIQPIPAPARKENYVQTYRIHRASTSCFIFHRLRTPLRH